MFLRPLLVTEADDAIIYELRNVMIITDLLERNAKLYGSETALVEINPSEERDMAVTWRPAT